MQSDTYYPGWTAEVDGVPVTLHRVNLALRGVIVSKGSHEVILRYTPRRIMTALWVGLFATGLLGLLSVISLVRAFRRRGGRQKGWGKS